MSFSPPASLVTPRHLGSENAPLFQPPTSPALVASPSFTSNNDYFTAGSRKRQRPDSAQSQNGNTRSALWAETPNWAQFPTPRDDFCGSPYGQDSALVNERYRLVDGFDTPSLRSTSRLEQLTGDEHEFRRRIRDDDMGNSLLSDRVLLSGPLARERNGMARVPPPVDIAPQTTWTSFAFGIVGKFFSFGSHVFKGFYAGGGKGYNLQQSHLPTGSGLFVSNPSGTSSPLPGSWLQEDFLDDLEQESPSYDQQKDVAARPPNKRRHTDRDTWVLVGTPDSELTPKRKVVSNTAPRSSLASKYSASRASTRKSIAPLPRRTSYVASDGSPHPSSIAPPPARPSLSRRASFAPMRSPNGRSGSFGSPNWMGTEAERYAKRQAKQDRVTDKAMNNMGRRMEEMIRQAQEALGTKYSVEGDLEMEDEGYVDDDW